jgi:hypothetical protein
MIDNKLLDKYDDPLKELIIQVQDNIDKLNAKVNILGKPALLRDLDLDRIDSVLELYPDLPLDKVVVPVINEEYLMNGYAGQHVKLKDINNGKVILGLGTIYRLNMLKQAEPYRIDISGTDLHTNTISQLFAMRNLLAPDETLFSRSNSILCDRKTYEQYMKCYLHRYMFDFGINLPEYCHELDDLIEILDNFTRFLASPYLIEIGKQLSGFYSISDMELKLQRDTILPFKMQCDDHRFTNIRESDREKVVKLINSYADLLREVSRADIASIPDHALDLVEVIVKHVEYFKEQYK